MITNTPKPETNLSQRTATGSGWSFATRTAQQVLSLIQVAILGRLLSPEAFGIMGIATLATYAIGVFTYTGYGFALVQKPDLHSEDIDTAWWVGLGRQLLVGVVLALLAKPIAHFYEVPAAIPLLLAMALVQPISGLANPSLILLQRDLQFRILFLVELLSSIVGLIVGVIAALLLRNVWALLLALAATAITRTIRSYFVQPCRVHLRFSWHSFRQLSSYGWWMLGSAILWFVFSQGSTAFSGWMFGVTALGLYQMAGRFALLPSTHLGNVLQGAVFPAYALIQDDKARVSRAFLRMLNLAAMTIIGLTALIALGLPRLVALILGEQWIEAATLVPTIAVAGGLQALLRAGAPLYLGTGRPHYQFFMDLTQTAVMVSLLYPLGRYFGLIGLPFAVMVGALGAVPVWWLGVREATHCTWRDMISALLPAILGAGVMTLIFFVGQLLPVTSSTATLGLIWHISLLGLAGTGFLGTIAISQHKLPHYAPLVELQHVLGTRWRHLLPAFKQT